MKNHEADSTTVGTRRSGDTDTRQVTQTGSPDPHAPLQPVPIPPLANPAPTPSDDPACPPAEWSVAPKH